MTKKAIFIFAILATAQSARADYHYASHDGSDEYPYISWETAAHLIQDAVNAASPHDTVYIGAGEYYERVWVPEATTHLGIIGMGWESTHIWYDVQGNHMLRVSDSCIVESIHLQHTRGVCLSGHLYTYLITVRDCKFSGEERRGLGIMSSVYGSSIIVENCIFHDLRGGIETPYVRPLLVSIKNCAFDSLHSYGIWVWGVKVVIQRNICSGAGMNFYWWDGPVDTTIFTNNLSVNNHGAFGDGSIHEWDVINNNISIDDSWYNPNVIYPAFVFDPVYDLRAYNNIIISEGVGIDAYIRQPEYQADFRYNNLLNDTEDIRVYYYDNIDTSVIYHEFPMFVGDGDYHLQAFSPLIDAGHPEILDVDGTRSDIGVYGGPGGCSYTYLDLAPLIPDSITVEVEEQLITLNWRFNTEADFNRYQIFRDTVSGFTPSEFNMIAEPDTSYYEDQDIDPGTAYYYRLTSVDNQGNVSDYSDEVGFIPTDISPSPGDRLPRYTVIESAYPNPFNSDITIVYSASNLGPQPPAIKLQIFDIQGRLVKTLIDERIPMGTYRAVWDGTDDHGWPVSSGVYIARVYQWGMDGDFPIKITLIR